MPAEYLRALSFGIGAGASHFAIRSYLCVVIRLSACPDLNYFMPETLQAFAVPLLPCLLLPIFHENDWPLLL
jgi:hypothetical protein